MSKIEIKSVKYLDRFLQSIKKFVSTCKFDIDSEKCTVRSKNLIARAFFTTNVMVSEEPVSFCLNELQYLCKSVSTLREFKEAGDDTCTLLYDKPFVKMHDIVKFKLSTIDESRIEEHLTTDLKTKLEPTFGCQISLPMMRKLASMSFMADDTPKVYLHQEGDTITGEIDDKTQDLTNSISIPLTKRIIGTWDETIVTDLDSFRMWNLLDADEIVMTQVTSGAIKAIMTRSEIKDEEGLFVRVNLLAQVLKK